MNFKHLMTWVALGLLAGALGLSGCAGRTEELKKQTREQRQQIQQLEDRIGTLNNAVDTLTWQRDKTRQRLAKNQQIVSKLRKQIEKMKTEEARRLEKLRKQNQKLEEDLSEIKKAQTRREGKSVVITLGSRILFGLGEDELKPESKKTLDKIADVLKDHPKRRILVEGHTDTVPLKPDVEFETNWHLSASRAVSVVQYLTNKHNLSPSRITAAGYGEHQPIKPNSTAENRRLNRRVELVLYPPKLEKKTIEP